MSSAGPAFSVLSHVIALFSIAFAVYIIFSQYWLEEKYEGSLMITSTQAGLWKWCNYHIITAVSCDSLTKLNSSLAAPQALCVLGALVINLIALAMAVFTDITKNVKLQNWKINAAVVVLYLIASLFAIIGVIDYLKQFLFRPIGQSFLSSMSIGYSFSFVVCAALLTGLCAVLYATAVGYNFEKKEVNRLVSTLIMAAGVFAVITAFLGVTSPMWIKYVSSKNGQISTASLWQYCVKNTATGERQCSKIIDAMLNGHKFRPVQNLAITSLVFLVLSVFTAILTSFIFKQKLMIRLVVLCGLVMSGLLICATFFQFLIVLFYTTPVGSPQFRPDYALSIMIFCATATGVAGVIKSIVVGCQMASGSK